MDLISIISICIFYIVIVSTIVMLIIGAVSTIKSNSDTKKLKKEITDLYQNQIWDEFIKMAEDGQFVYSPENSIKNDYEVFILKNKNNTPRYRFCHIGDNTYAVFNYPICSNDRPTCVLSSFNKDKAKQMYDILKVQIR